MHVRYLTSRRQFIRGLLTILLLYGQLLMLTATTQAQSPSDWVVRCHPAGCLRVDEGEFLPSEPWSPGQKIERTLEVVNDLESPGEASLWLEQLQQTQHLATAVQLRIAHQTSRRSIWSGSLTEFSHQEPVSLSTVPPGSSAKYILQLSLDKAAGDQYQAATLSFNLTASLRSNSHPASGSSQAAEDQMMTTLLSPIVSDAAVEGLNVQRFFASLVSGSLTASTAAAPVAALTPVATHVVANQLGIRDMTWLWVLIVEVMLVYVTIWQVPRRWLPFCLGGITVVSVVAIGWGTGAPLPVLMACIPGMAGYLFRSNYVCRDPKHNAL